MRERTTWQKNGNETPRQAATSRQADIYTMNQEHPQPSPVDYENGSPDSWAETPVPGDKMTVNAEYDGDHVKRNEIGMGEFRDDTWKHKDSDKWDGPGKYDNAKVAAERKAHGAERLARAMLRTSNDKVVEDVALELMALPDRAMAAALRSIDKVSTESMPQEARLRRAMACTKLSSRLLGDSATEQHVEKLATLFMTVDDPTLKGMLKVVASVHVAQQQEQQEEEEEEQQGQQGQQQEEEQEEEEQQGQQSQQQQQQSQQQQQQSQQQQGQQQQSQQEQQSQQQQGQQQEQEEEEEEQEATSAEGCMPASDMALLDQMLHQEMAEHGGGDDLSALFQAAPAPAAPVPMIPGIAGDTGISFDDDEPDARTASSGDELDALFADDPEVQAQRQIKAAEQEQSARAGGYSVGRTASSKGAKKIGQVRKAQPASVDQALETLWDRP